MTRTTTIEEVFKEDHQDIEIPYNDTLNLIIKEPKDFFCEPVPNNDIDSPPIHNEVSDFPSLFKYVNEIYTVSMNNKTACNNLRNQLFYINTRITDIESEFKTFKSDIAGRVLGTEVEIEELKTNKIKSLENINRRIDRNTTNIDKATNYSNVQKRLENELEEIHKKIKVNIETLESITAETTRTQTKDYQLYNNDTLPEQNQYTTARYKRYETPDTNKIIFDHDVLFFVDSNLKRIKPEKMDANSSCERFYCPRLEHISEVLGKAEIKKNPKKIFISCGTNHIYSGCKDTSKLENDFFNIIMKLRGFFPLASIYISSLLPRGDLYVKNSVQYINDFLCGVCCADNALTFIRNNNIFKYQLVDNKHINYEAFKILISNIKFYLFGKIPRYKEKY